jgi:hypothetical protein
MHRQVVSGSNTQRSATPPSTSRPALEASEPSASPSTRTGRRSRGASAAGRPRRDRPPLQRQAQQQLEPGGAGLGLAEGQVFVVVDRVVVGHQRVQRAVGQRGAQRVAVAPWRSGGVSRMSALK